MPTPKFLATEKLLPWLTRQAADRRVLAPVREGEAVVFRPFASGRTLCLDQPATVSPKTALIPPSETLMAYRYVKDPEDPDKVVLDVHETLHTTPTLLFGVRPCDARGAAVIDRVFADPENPDKYYTARRDTTVVASIACTTPAPTCFCHWTGGDPAGSEGSDILLTPVTGGYLALALTPRGEPFLEDENFTAPPESAQDEAEAAHAAAREALGEATDLTGAPEHIAALFDHTDLWQQVSDKCLSCGVCSYVCPTCYCFNITDEPKGSTGTRVRSWDNCMSALFTLEGSGHNPRADKSQRFRNRVGHKFAYYPQSHGGEIACVGCGRCIRSCPVSMDIREVLCGVLAHEPHTETEAQS